MRRSYEFLGAIAAIALVPACSGGSNDSNATSDGEAVTTAAAAGTADPCSLFTVAEVQEVVGVPIKSASADGEYCHYAIGDSSNVDVQYVVGNAKEKMDIDRKVGDVMGGMGDAVSGQGGAGADVNAMMHDGGGSAAIGDESLLLPQSGISFRKGDAYVAITPPLMRDPMTATGNPLFSGEEKLKMSQDLARRALAKLK